VPEQDRDAVQRALLDCPVHAIIAVSATAAVTASTGPPR
jgi:hypothetical protein